MSEQGQGGHAVTRALRAFGVDHIFTLSGAHIFPIYDGAVKGGDIRLIDTRHEQSATFAAEGWARLTRSLGVAALTAGPGVTNAVSALTQARFNGAPVLALGGRAPSFRWGQGSLQEIDHVPFIDPIAPARTVFETPSVMKEVTAAALDALTPPKGPRFLDFPLDVLYDNVELSDPGDVEVGDGPAPDPGDLDEVARLLAEAERPILIVGSAAWLEGAEDELRALAEKADLPVFMNGQGRGCLPADHRLAFARARSAAFKQTDLAIVAGTKLDFRLGFGQSFGPQAKVIHIDSAGPAEHVPLAAAFANSTKLVLGAAAEAVDERAGAEWVEQLRTVEEEKKGAAAAELSSDALPIHPMRVYGELVPVLERDAVVICDGGDFVSYAGREVPSYEPGCWLDPGPFGCLGVGPGYAIAARLAHPDRQVVVLFGDGAIGFSGMELETLVRLDLPVVCVVGNNGIWGLEKHPMQALYGYDVVADLRPGVRYDLVMKDLGGHGELVTEPDGIAPALRRAFDSGTPAVVNVLTDPAVAYPRSANLA